ncbi:DUF4097 domain-containing protein [Acidobacteria bacterium AB60]|nr:DUF4097 domain-containing protein [Acidobacteria bacterium AB60]
MLSLARIVVLSTVPAVLAACLGTECLDEFPARPGLTASIVRVHQVGGAIDIGSAPDGADLSTMGGDIHVGNSGAFVHAKTMGGDITVDQAAGVVDASTMGGKINIGRTSGSIKASTMAGDVTAHLTGPSTAPRDVTLSSMSGAILLTVPKDYGMEVQIKLAYTKNSEGKYRVIQHLGLNERQSTEWDTSHGGSPLKYIYVTGRVGNGQNRVKIETINGDIALKLE